MSAERSVEPMRQISDFDWIMGIGALSLGVVIGWMAVKTFLSQKVLTTKVFGSIVSVLGGGAVLGIFSALGRGSPSSHELWLYPVGLLCGVVAPSASRMIAQAGRESNSNLSQGLLGYLEGRNLPFVSFQEALSDLDWDKEELRATIDCNPKLFYIVRGEDGSPAIAIKKQERQSEAASAATEPDDDQT
jgi:hypothetical protein